MTARNCQCLARPEQPPTKETTMRKRIITLALAAALGVLGLQTAALADPDFGTGESSKKNNDPGAVCSPSPKLDADLPQCKD
jgi:hypothetical protein